MAEDSIKTPSGNKTLDQIRGGMPQDSGKSKSPKKPQKQESWWKSIAIALLIALVIRSFFVEAFRIPTGSMKNTLLVGDYLFVNKVSYFFRTPKYLPLTSVEIPHFSFKTGGISRGDILVFEYPGDRDLVIPHEKKVNYIKRCIGLPGDSIQVINKQVYVNGVAMVNPPEYQLKPTMYKKGDIDMRIFPKDAPWNADNYGAIRIPKAGDVVQLTRNNAAQWEVFIAREGHNVQLGPDGVLAIDGKAATSYTVQRDYLWMMGDNRDDSEDSRFWGFMPVENVVGGALFIYWSWYHPPAVGSGSDQDRQQDGYDPEEQDQSTHIRWGRIGRIIR